MKTNVSKFFSGGAIVAAVIVVGVGLQYGTAFANGSYSFTPIDLSRLAISYNAPTQSVILSGTMTTGNEGFFTVGGGCSQTPFGTYWVNGPLNPDANDWTIVDATGATVLSGSAPLNQWILDASSGKPYDFPCATVSIPTIFNMVPTDSLNVSALAPGAYTYNMVMTPSGCVASSPDTYCTVTAPTSTWSGSFVVPPPVVTPPPPSSSTGTITVISKNAVTGDAVSAAGWDIVGGATDICDEQGINCSGLSATYSNQPANTLYDILNATIPAASIGANCSNAPDCYAAAPVISVPSQYLNPNQTISFSVNWNPIANMSLSQNTWSATAPSDGSVVDQKVMLNNTGAPGSTLTWSANSSASWLSATPAADATGLTNSGSADASENVTITADPSGLSVGTYTGKITFTGVSSPGTSANPTASLTVTFTVTSAAASGGFSCINNACTAVSSGGVSQADCNVACGEQPPTSTTPGFSCIKNACTSVPSGGVLYASCENACGGGGGGGGGSSYSCVKNACVLVASGGTSLPNCQAACGGGGGGGGGMEYSCKSDACVAVVSGGVSQQDCAAACGAPAAPTCSGANCQAVCNPSLTASPTSIVVPESSNLTYSCSHVTACQLSGGQFNSGQNVPISGNESVTPSMTTTYTLTCVNSNYSGDSVTSNAKVTVSGSILCEQNPNAVGCPGQ